MSKLFCHVGWHRYVFYRRRAVGGAWYHRTDRCERCGCFETWRERNGVKRGLLYKRNGDIYE